MTAEKAALAGRVRWARARDMPAAISALERALGLTERLIHTSGAGGLDIVLCARSCVVAWSRGDAGVRRGTRACGGTPGSGKITEDPASTEDPVPDRVPFSPLKPDLPQ